MTDPAPTDEQVAVLVWLAESAPLSKAAEVIAAVPALAAALASARAENAALHESLNVTAERAAGDRRALDEAQAEVERLAEELAGARATLAHQCEAMSWLGGHDRQGLDHLQEAMDACEQRDAAEAAVERIERELLSRCMVMSHGNGYRVEAIPKATLLDYFAALAATQPTESAPR